jgi:hypothetical protein
VIILFVLLCFIESPEKWSRAAVTGIWIYEFSSSQLTFFSLNHACANQKYIQLIIGHKNIKQDCLFSKSTDYNPNLLAWYSRPYTDLTYLILQIYCTTHLVKFYGHNSQNNFCAFLCWCPCICLALNHIVLSIPLYTYFI